MKIVVIGGTGLIGRQVVTSLRDRGHDAVAASPSTGVDTVAGTGLDDAVDGADVVVDVSNSPDFGDDAVLEFFRASGHNLAKAEAGTGVGHHVALTIVGADRVPDSGYMRAKLAQEAIVKDSGVPYTLVRATQFYEFLRTVADVSTEDGTVRTSSARLQPVAAADVARAVTDAALAEPANAIVEVAGPDRIPLHELLRRVLAAEGDTREVLGDVHGRYFGTELTDDSITAGPDARLGAIGFADWLTATHG